MQKLIEKKKLLAVFCFMNHHLFSFQGSCKMIQLQASAEEITVNEIINARFIYLLSHI